MTTATIAEEVRMSAVLERALGAEVESIEASPHPYATSHLLVDVDAELADGRRISAVVKETGRRPPHRPRFVHRAHRERDAYRRLLNGSGLPVPRLLGVAGPYVVLDRVAAAPLWETADEGVARRVGQAIRALHDGLSGRRDVAFALRYDVPFYDRWLRRACSVDPALAGLAGIYGQATARLLREPQTPIHGELYPSNVLVGERIWVVDWESVAVGPAAIDLAAAVSGWPEPFGRAVLAGYGAFDRVALDCARLQLAVRWLGWSPGWTPPPDHARDWKREAERVAERLREGLG
jgi:aminoglycoside phosphotransferase (APT) family kinase protein